MSQQEERREEHGDAAPPPLEVTAETRQRRDAAEDAQTLFWTRVHDANRKWLERMQSEASMAADFASKLTVAKSFTETAGLVQNWTARHLELAGEDARRVFADTQEILSAGARLWSRQGQGDGESRH